jgi:hypothetical protein
LTRISRKHLAPVAILVVSTASAGDLWDIDETCQDVANPIIGSWWRGTAGRQSWGRIYIEHRIVSGFTFSSPARGGSVSREATARFGYVRSMKGCLDLELFMEKRSFNFADSVLPHLYTKSKRTGVAISCRR